MLKTVQYVKTLVRDPGSDWNMLWNENCNQNEKSSIYLVYIFAISSTVLIKTTFALLQLTWKLPNDILGYFILLSDWRGKFSTVIHYFIISLKFCGLPLHAHVKISWTNIPQSHTHTHIYTHSFFLSPSLCVSVSVSHTYTNALTHTHSRTHTHTHTLWHGRT